MKILSSKRRAAVGAALVLLALFLVRPGASRLKSRIIYSISTAVGRPVDIGSVHIRLLPRPAFDLNNLVVYDEPGFGAEPILRAGEVTASLRLSSLLRGRLEIARLDLSEPSLNLARREGGSWNFLNVLERSARIPLAPTAKGRLEARVGFPYIEGTSGRINFKNGAEKTPYALTNADFSLWQESDNTWGLRLKAQPFRGDMNLNDMGVLQLNGTWQRSQEIRDTPLQFSVEWSRAQLGQLTKFVTGADEGWRGEILLDLTLQGTPADLHISASTSVDDFRRYDITRGKALRLAGYCDAQYSSLSREFHKVMCGLPLGNGMISLTGDLGLPGSARYSVAMTADEVPANLLGILAQRMKKNLPDDIAAAGTLHATLSLEKNEKQSRVEARGAISNFQIGSGTGKTELGPVTVPFALVSSSAVTGASRQRLNAKSTSTADRERFEIGPFVIGSARGGSTTVRGWIDGAGFEFAVLGEAEVAKSLRLARILGIPALNSTADGSAQVDLKIAGTWASTASEVAPPQVTGTAKLYNLQIAAHNFGGPVEILSAEMQLSPDMVRVARLNAKAAGTTWTGSLQMPRGCGNPDVCPIRFALNTTRFAMEDISQWTHPNSKKRPWYRLLEANPGTQPTLLPVLHATGKVTADSFQVHGVQAAHVSSHVTVDDGTIQFSDIAAEVLDGKHLGEWAIDLSTKPAVCKGNGFLSEVSSAALADAMHDEWVAGTANASYELKGTCGSQFWKSAEGTVRADLSDGSFPHIALGENAEALRVSGMRGEAHLRDGEIKIGNTEISTSDAVYQLSGTASLDRELDLKMNRVRGHGSTDGFTISGTLAEPQVTSFTGREQAHLKSPPAQ